MKINLYPLGIIHLIFLALGFSSFHCGNAKSPKTEDIVAPTEDINIKVAADIKEILAFGRSDSSYIDDSTILFDDLLLEKFYNNNAHTSMWASAEKWSSKTVPTIEFIKEVKWYGLFPEDYHYSAINNIYQRIMIDTLLKSDRRDAVLWAKADIMLTDAFFHILKDLKLGRLPNDSISLRKDSVLEYDFYKEQFEALSSGTSFKDIASKLEPKHIGYHALKDGIKDFLSNTKNTVFEVVPNVKDTGFTQALQKRLFQGGYIASDTAIEDSSTVAKAIKKFQKENKINVDGKAGETTIRLLNFNEREKFIRIAISMDKYKLLPEEMPAKYIWVNLPSFYLHFIKNDTIRLSSKIVCGKAKTRTPLLTSKLSDIVVYPQWTPPTSIIVKEILPAVKKDPGYLAKKGFSLLDKNGDEVDPFSVDWAKYSKGIPYRVVQGSGDANALGVLKFNFPNKYAVYLHDTNQRYLFGQAVRTLSHGCVRVQEWQQLANDILLENANIDFEMDEEINLPIIDSMMEWLNRKEKHIIPLKSKIPLFIRYFTCEGKNQSIIFFDDIYAEDKNLREKYFSNK